MARKALGILVEAKIIVARKYHLLIKYQAQHKTLQQQSALTRAHIPYTYASR